MTRSSKTVAVTRPTSPRQPNQDLTEREKSKVDVTKKAQTTKKSKTKARKDSSSNVSSTTTPGDDTMSVNTHVGNNTSDIQIDTTHTSFLFFQLKVEDSKKNQKQCEQRSRIYLKSYK